MWGIRLTAVLLLMACGESSTDVVSLAITIEPQGGLIVGAGGTCDFLAAVTDESGQIVYSQTVTWSVENTSIATIDQNGLATGVSVGTTSVTASVGEASRSVRLEVYVPEVISSYEVGKSYFGRNNYVEYIPGELPIVISAPHGGVLQPAEAADRTSGRVIADRNTVELSLAVRDALSDATGYAPHVILSHLHRSKLDPNREIVEAAQGDPFAENAWHEFQDWIEEARVFVADDYDRGLYFDMHGHGHSIPRVEIGYLLSGSDLNQNDDALNNMTMVEKTSIRDLGRHAPETFSELLRGPKSFGGFLGDEGVRSIPSPEDPSPGSYPYYTGGYNTREHGSRSPSEIISGIQLEHQYPGLRDSDANRRVYAAQLASAIRIFMLEHFGFFEPGS
jgi:hypothetical protein